MAMAQWTFFFVGADIHPKSLTLFAHSGDNLISESIRRVNYDYRLNGLFRRVSILSECLCVAIHPFPSLQPRRIVLIPHACLISIELFQEALTDSLNKMVNKRRLRVWEQRIHTLQLNCNHWPLICLASLNLTSMRIYNVRRLSVYVELRFAQSTT